MAATDSNGDHTLGETLDAALAWWREAGVEGDFANQPRNWLERPEPREKPASPAARAAATPQVPPLGGERAQWPDTLEAFAQWWCEAPALETPGSGPRVPPRGVAQAELMVLVPMPEREDRERLLSGEQGAMVGRMVEAMAGGEDNAYIAAALPRHAAHPDWEALAERQLGDILRHHIALAAPRRLLVLGRELLPLFGHDPAQLAANAGPVALEGVRVPTLASFAPESMLDNTRFKKNLWEAWQRWTEGKE